MNLKKARNEGKIEEFIQERELLEGNKILFDKVINSISGKLKPAQETSSQDSP